MGAFHSTPWRILPQNQNELRHYLKSYKPKNEDVSSLRILLYGQTGAGKSSFINSVESAILGQVSGRIQTDAASSTSFTKKFQTYKINKGDQSHCSFVFNDTMGLEGGTGGLHFEDIKLALKGHVAEGYEFIPNHPLTEGNPGYNSSPSLADKVHVLVFVVDANTLPILSDKALEKMRDARLAASDMGIPQMVILTQTDKTKDGDNVYKSKYLKKLVDKFHLQLGIPINCTFLVKNYVSEMDTNEVMDVQILLALRQMVHYGEDFLNNLP